MKRLLRHLTTPTAKKSTLFFFGSLFISFGRYLFHLILLRLLSPQSYGEFLSYVSMLYLLTIPSGVIQTLVNRYVSIFHGKNDKKSINSFFYYLTFRTFIPALFISLPVVLFAKPLAIIFKAHPSAFVVLAIMTVFSLVGSVIRAYLPALQQFVSQVMIGFLELVVLIISAFALINLGLSATGGVVAMLLSVIFGTTITLVKIWPHIWPPITKPPKTKINGFLIHSLVFSAGPLSLMSTDILLVRYFLSAHQSGLYAALSILGRMIYFGLTPLSSLILPIATSRHAQKKATHTVFYKLLASAVILGVSATTIFSLFPSFVINILSGPQYLEIAPLLPFMATAMMFLGFNFLTLSYFLATDKYYSTIILVLFTIIQPLLVTFYHSSLYQIVTLNLTIQICLFASLLIYYKISNSRLVA